MNINFTHFLKQLPFIRLVFPFILGITFQINWPNDYTFYPYLIIILLIILILSSAIFETKKRYFFRYIPGIIINLLIFFIGILSVKVNSTKPFLHLNDEITVIATISEPIHEKENTYKALIKLNVYKHDSIWSLTNDKIIAYFKKSDDSKELKYGDKILFRNRISEIKNAGNPYEFDYNQFLTRKGINGQIFLKDECWQIINQNKGNPIFSKAYKIRDYLKNIYKEHNFKDQELAVLQALTLGDKSEIEADTKQSYVSSGAMHILAVSGLHVGIIFFLFNFFLRCLDRLKYKNYYFGKWVKAIILIFILWAFALLSGLSPSVSRAAVMFSFVIFGKAMKRHINIYNSLAASAFLLLIIDPYQITNVGFQLSYCAVLAIVFFQPKIANLFVINNKIIYYLWSLTAVSIAAQIGTFPVSLFYFHIFPNLFFITNIIVIPLATLIIYGAVLLLITSFIPYVSDIFSFILKKMLISLNWSVEFIEKIPYSSTNNISFLSYDLILAYSFIISISIFIFRKKPSSLHFSICILVLWISLGFIYKTYINSKDQLIIYNIKNETAVNIIGDQNYLIGKNSLIDVSKIKYGPMSNWLKLNKANYKFIDIQLSAVKNKTFLKRDNYIIAGNKRIILINHKDQLNYKINKRFEVDLVVLSDDSKVSISNIQNLYNFKTIIFDSSNSYYAIREWEDQCKKLGKAFHSINKQGAYSIKL